MENITEVVFGDSLSHEIKMSKFSKNNTIIKFEPLFSICDLSNIDKYILTLNDEYCDLTSSEIYDVSNTYSLKNIIKDIEESIKKKNKIRIWTTHKQIDSYLMFLYVCNYFSNTDSELYVLFSDEFDKECYVFADEHKISQVIYNFIVNAINYSSDVNKIIIKKWRYC